VINRITTKQKRRLIVSTGYKIGMISEAKVTSPRGDRTSCYALVESPFVN
jgi:hypothetical protein